MFTYGLLASAILAVWINPIKVSKQHYLHLWILLFLAACSSGLVSGYLTLTAVLVLGMLGAVAYLATREEASRLQRIVFGTLTALFSLALALHRIPGFSNPIILENIRLSTDAPLFTQYVNFDKGAVGMILLAFFCRRTTTVPSFTAVIKQSSPIAAVTTACVIATAMTIGMVRPDFKLSSTTAIFLGVNLIFTVIAEEAFFRGFLQARLSASLHRFRFGGHFAVIFSAILFGAAHVAGGANYFFVAILSGFGYAYAFFVFRRVEAPIFIHFALNGVHFIGFTYPYIK